MATHAKFSPSAATRWLKCTASPDAEAGLPGTTSDAASTGTVYHAIAAHALGQVAKLGPGGAVGESWTTEANIVRAVTLAYNAVVSRPLEYMGPRDAAATSLVDEETALDLLVPYVVDALALAIHPKSYTMIESRVDALLETAPGVMFGTADCLVIEPDMLHVLDLKTGRWPVSPVDNAQLLTYAAGALYTYEVLFGEDPPPPGDMLVGLHVHQGGAMESWQTTVQRVREHVVELEAAYRSALVGGEFVPGEHCRWCRAKDTCGAYAGRAVELARSEFATPYADPEEFHASLKQLPGETFAEMFTRFELINEMVNTAREVAARRMFDEGLSIPGHKLIRGTKYKAWIDKDEVPGVLGEGAYKKELITPAQAIKKFGEESVSGLWHVPVGELKVVPEKMRGTPVTPAAAAEFIGTGDNNNNDNDG